MFVVVGSGPAGVACAHALLQRGAKVTMLDAGLDLESDRKAQVAALRSVPHDRWSAESLRFLHDGVSVEAGGIPLKMAYGSSFPYREPVDLPLSAEGAEGKPSYARGGFSNVWGASMLPFRSEDIAGWPITAADLEPHYRAVLELIPNSELKASAQAGALLRDLGSAKTAFQFSPSRLAVDPKCVRCGLCLYGCPYGYIYNSADTLSALRADRNFTYRPGVVVQRVTEASSHVELSGVTVDRETPFAMSVDRAFLACGVFSTARILLASVEAFGETVRAADNCYFLLPLLRYRNQKDVRREALHTLAQVFLELHDDAIGRHTVHLQVYTYNELLRQQIRNMVGPLAPLAEGAVLGRLLLIQGYLHSDLSPSINVSLDRDGTLSLTGEPNARTKPALDALRKRMWSERSALRAFPVARAMRVGKPGRGFHTGGTFPMRAQPGRLETDVDGRLRGFSRLHVVDASVFPSLPATTITLSVMANAHRIGGATVA